MLCSSEPPQVATVSTALDSLSILRSSAHSPFRNLSLLTMRYCRLFALVVSVLVFARPGFVSASKGSNVTTSDFRVLEHGPSNELQDIRSIDKEAAEDRVLPFGAENAATKVATHLAAMREAFTPSAASVGRKMLTADEELAHIRGTFNSMKTSSNANRRVDHEWPNTQHNELADLMLARPSFLAKNSLFTSKMSNEAVKDMYTQYKKIISTDRDLAVLIQLAKDFGTPTAKRNAESLEKVQFEAWAKENYDPEVFSLKWDTARSALHGRNDEVAKVREAYKNYRLAN